MEKSCRMWWLTDDDHNSEFWDFQNDRSSWSSAANITFDWVQFVLLLFSPHCHLTNTICWTDRNRVVSSLKGSFANNILFLFTIFFFSHLHFYLVSAGVCTKSKWLLKFLGEFWCQLVQYLIVVTALVSIYTLVLMSVARLSLLL